MGLSLQNLQGNGPRMNGKDLNINTGFVWIVIRREPKPDGPPDVYIQGIADDEEEAIGMCRDETYFIGPLPKNRRLKHDRQNWVGSYFPLKKNTEQIETEEA